MQPGDVPEDKNRVITQPRPEAAPLAPRAVPDSHTRGNTTMKLKNLRWWVITLIALATVIKNAQE